MRNDDNESVVTMVKPLTVKQAQILVIPVTLLTLGLFALMCHNADKESRERVLNYKREKSIEIQSERNFQLQLAEAKYRNRCYKECCEDEQ